LAQITATVQSTRSYGWGDKLSQVLAFVTLPLMALTLYMTLIYAPTDATQGDVQRIFYYHVPTAWNGFLAFFLVFVASVVYLFKSSRFWDALARASAEVGLVFTTIMIITGSLWGKPVWGTWWSWDPRMTTTLILWFIYLGYLMLRAYAPSKQQGARYAAVLGIVGFVDVPIVYMSTKWWRTLHPQQVVEPGQVSMPPEMLQAFMVSLLAFTLLFIWILIIRTRIALIEDELEIRSIENG